MSIKTSWKGLVFGLFLMVLGGFVSATAQASAPGTNSAVGTLASTPVQDCSTGCRIITCNGSICTVWYCSGKTGCVVEGRYIKQTTEAQRVGSLPDAPQSVEYIKTCQTNTLCNLYAMGDRGAVLVGTFDNIQGAAERYSKLKH